MVLVVVVGSLALLPCPWSKIMAVVLGGWLRSRDVHFGLKGCWVATAGLCCLALGSVAGGFGMACGLWLVGALPFGKPPWIQNYTTNRWKFRKSNENPKPKYYFYKA